MTDLELLPDTHPNLWTATDAAGIVAEATHTADTLATVIRQQRLAVRIQGGEHVKVEGWTLLGSLLGLQPYVCWSKPLRDEAGDIIGWEARVEARTLDGRTISAAEAQCTRQERTWKTRDDYALRSMAQTRAVSKAMRLPLGFVMSLAGFNPTPYEEMPPNTPVRSTVVLGPEVDTEPPPARGVPGTPPADDNPFQVPELREDRADSGPLTEPQRKKIYAIASKIAKAEPEFEDRYQAYKTRAFGTEAVSELTRAQARQLIDLLVAKEKELGL